jgi:hypothetical protein
VDGFQVPPAKLKALLFHNEGVDDVAVVGGREGGGVKQ